MDLWQLHIFSKVVETQSFSKAGKQVHLSQPTVSSHIKDLEQHFGCRLIDRLSKKAVPTKAGEILYVYAQRLLSLRDEAETAIAEYQGKMKGHIVLGGSTIPAGYLLPRIIGRFKRDFPDVRVSMTVGATDRIIQKTLAGELELGIVGAKPEDNSAAFEKLLDDELMVIVPPSHPWSRRQRVSVEELCAEPFILREKGSGSLRALQQALAHVGSSSDDLSVVAEMGSTEAVYQGIKSGIGISLLSLLAVEDDIRRGEMVALRVDGLTVKRSIYLVRERHRTISPLARQFRGYLIAAISEEDPSARSTG